METENLRGWMAPCGGGVEAGKTAEEDTAGNLAEGQVMPDGGTGDTVNPDKGEPDIQTPEKGEGGRGGTTYGGGWGADSTGGVG